MANDANDMTFYEHLEAMRPGLMRSVAALLIFMIVAFILKDYIMAIIMAPKMPWFSVNVLMNRIAGADSADITLINTALAGQFNMHLLMSFYVALLLTLPYILFEIWLFVKPALTQHEIHAGRVFFVATGSCMVIGVIFGYFILAPVAVRFLGTYILSTEITNMIDIRSYISVVMHMIITCGIVFELPVLVYFLSRLHILTAAFMRRYRRHAIIALAVAAAVITPPDIVSMILVMIPLYMLYELSIYIASANERASQEAGQMEANDNDD